MACTDPVARGVLPQSTDVVVVGGGLSGLAAAVVLSEYKRVVVIEQENHLGGRAASWSDPKTGDSVHIGPHVFLSIYRFFPALLELINAERSIVWQRERFITLVDRRKAIQIRLSGWPAPLHLLRDSLSKWDVGPRDLLSNTPLTVFALQATEVDVLRLDSTDARTFLRSMGCSRASIENHWALICLAIMNVPLELCSAGSLIRFYRELMSYGDLCFGFPDGGLGDLFSPAAKRTIEERGGVVATGTRVVALTGTPSEATGVRLEDGRTIRATQVISSVPAHVLERLLPAEWKDREPYLGTLDRFEPCPYVSTYLWFDRKLTDLKFWVRVYNPKDLNCDFYDLSNINRAYADRPSIIASNIIYSHRFSDLDDDAIVRGTLKELAEFLPEASAPGALRHSVVHRIPMGVHCPVPGTEALRPTQRTAVRNLYLSGDWTRTDVPASMESAVKSGFMSAEAALEDRGINRRVLPLAWGSVRRLPTVVTGLARLATRVARPLMQRQLVAGPDVRPPARHEGFSASAGGWLTSFSARGMLDRSSTSRGGSEDDQGAA